MYTFYVQTFDLDKLESNAASCVCVGAYVGQEVGRSLSNRQTEKLQNMLIINSFEYFDNLSKSL